MFNPKFLKCKYNIIFVDTTRLTPELSLPGEQTGSGQAFFPSPPSPDKSGFGS